MVTCPMCGLDLAESWEFCPVCGLPPEKLQKNGPKLTFNEERKMKKADLDKMLRESKSMMEENRQHTKNLLERERLLEKYHQAMDAQMSKDPSEMAVETIKLVAAVGLLCLFVGFLIGINIVKIL